jgi:hypothetical protein
MFTETITTIPNVQPDPSRAGIWMDMYNKYEGEMDRDLLLIKCDSLLKAYDKRFPITEESTDE